MEAEKEGFSYESPEKQRKTAFKVLFVELFSLAVAIVVIFGILAYLKIINIPSFIISDGIPKTAKDQILVSSEVKGTKLEVSDYEGLTILLNSWGVFNKNFQDNFGGTTEGVGVSKVNIILTDQEMPERKYTNEKIGGTFISSKTEASPGTLTVRVFVHPQILNDSSRSNEWGNFFQTGFISGLYHFTHPIQKAGDGGRIRGELDELLVDLYESGQNFFKISK